jgi:poly-gamma-glutamate capsule biosynthesis protein CapA/YwtB (metallophosphatase superfamily)
MHMRNPGPLIFLALLSMRLQAAELGLSVAPEARGYWERILADHPLPPGTVLRQAAGSVTAADRLSVTIGRPGAGGSAPKNGLRKIVRRIPLAPVASLWDGRQDVSSADVASGMVALERLTDIDPPRRALSVDGKFPADSSYPFYEETVLELYGRDRGISEWWKSIPDAERPAAPLWIAAVGDLMPARGVDEALIAGGPAAVFGDTLEVLRGGDLVLGNLEAASSERGAPIAKGYTFRFRPQALDELKSAGFSYLSLANNHCLDYGAEAFLDTLRHLAASGIATSGAGRDLAAAKGSASFQRKGQTVRVFSLALYPVENSGWDGRKNAAATPLRPGILWADEDAKEYLRTTGLKERGFRVVMVHGGEEWSRRPTAWFRDLCRELVDMGADAVLGSHPHVLQGMEGYRGSLIAYSLGNFVFPGMEETDGGEDSMILRIGVWEGKVRYVQPLPVRLHGTTVRLSKEPGRYGPILRMSREMAVP